jgi:hypothetical protein
MLNDYQINAPPIEALNTIRSILKGKVWPISFIIIRVGNRNESPSSSQRLLPTGDLSDSRVREKLGFGLEACLQG